MPQVRYTTEQIIHKLREFGYGTFAGLQLNYSLIKDND